MYVGKKQQGQDRSFSYRIPFYHRERLYSRPLFFFPRDSVIMTSFSYHHPRDSFPNNIYDCRMSTCLGGRFAYDELRLEIDFLY